MDIAYRFSFCISWDLEVHEGFHCKTISHDNVKKVLFETEEEESLHVRFQYLWKNIYIFLQLLLLNDANIMNFSLFCTPKGRRWTCDLWRVEINVQDSLYTLISCLILIFFISFFQDFSLSHTASVINEHFYAAEEKKNGKQ